MHLSGRETEVQGSSHQWIPHSSKLPWTAYFVDPGWISGPEISGSQDLPGILDCPALLKALGHSSLRWVPSGAPAGPGTSGTGMCHVRGRSPWSWPCDARTHHRGHLGGRPAGRKLSGPLRTPLGKMVSLSRSCFWSPGLTGTERPSHPGSGSATHPAGLCQA